MRRILTALALAGALVTPALPALAARGPPDRSGLDTLSSNGGDNGWGNCGRNSSGGIHDPLPGSAGNGNGGHRRGETCEAAVTPVEPTPVEPGPVLVLGPVVPMAT